MDCQFAIIHELVKTTNSTDTAVSVRKQVLDLTDEKVLSTVSSALSTIGDENNRIMRGIFLNNDRQGPFPRLSMKFFDSIQQNISKKITDTELENQFIDLTKQSLKEIQEQIVEGASYKMSTGGYLLFTLHKHGNSQFFSCMMIKKQNGIAIDENLNITDSIYIDLKKLLQSFTLNLTRHKQIREMSNDELDKVNSDESDDDLTYLKFIGHNKNRDPGADYFINAFGCERGSKSNIVTRAIIKGINDFCGNEHLKPFKSKIKDAVLEYLSTIPHNKEASLNGVKAVLNTHVQSIPDLPEDFKRDEVVNEFIDKLHQDREDGGYGVPLEFSVDQAIVKKNSRVRISGDNNDWMMDFRAGLIGKSEDSAIYFDKDKKSITINNLTDADIAKLEQIS
ncbi:nucleoid-associated protein [Uruburuella suis]|uniref:nucleoid-associated protein n=1 Tax=Uruburuella suis TaxID=252130 RepID=UPI003F4A98A5